MNKIYLVFLLFLAPFISKAGNTVDPVDKWYELIQYAGIAAEDLKPICPHFPDMTKYGYEKNNMQDFTQKRMNWMQKFPQEVQAFLDMPRIKKLNPSLVDLGLKKEGEETKQFEHPYWSWLQAAKLSESELKQVAPHFPKPMKSGNIDADISIYDLAINDWQRLFPKEMVALFNHPKMVAASGGFANGKFATNAPADADAYKSLVLANNYKPTPEQFTSGNPELDKIRFEMYLKKWYDVYDRMEFYRIYKPSEYEAYKKSVEEQSPKTGSNH